MGMIARTNPLDIVKASLTMWYRSSVPIFTRDPLEGLPADSDNTAAIPWSRAYSNEQHVIGNLGLMAMLMTSENWLPPKHPNLKAASLVSSAVTTVLVATYLICPQTTRCPSAFTTSAAQNDEALTLFIRAS